jgi:hypothetical protein
MDIDKKQALEILTKKQQELVKDTRDNILESQTFTALENLFNVVDVEIKRFEQSHMLQSAMDNAYKIIQQNKRKK